MHLAAIALGMCVVYAFLLYATPAFFRQPRPRFTTRSVYHAVVLLVLSALAYFVSFNIADTEVANRFLHAIGGGLIAAVMFYFVVTDSGLSLTHFQYFAASMLVVIALGVLNEHIEHALHTYTSGIYTTHLTDTWLDLLSNTVGAFAGTVTLMWRIHKRDA